VPKSCDPTPACPRTLAN